MANFHILICTLFISVVTVDGQGMLLRYRYYYRATACNATHGIAMRKTFVCLSVCPSVKPVDCDNTIEIVCPHSYQAC